MQARILLCAALVAHAISAAADEPDVTGLQAAMLAEIQRDFRETRGYTGRDTLTPRVLSALADVPRHEFVDHHDTEVAYINRPLPIGHGQTISQPFIVALMTDLLDPEPTDIVLEVGTGSAYQAAVLAKLVAHVYTIEIIPELARSAAARLTQLGYDNVSVRTGDGYFGWPEHGPYDGIIVTAVGPDIPRALLDQLKVGGRLVLPLGTQNTGQNLTVVTKGADGAYDTRDVLPVAFVPLTGNH